MEKEKVDLVAFEIIAFSGEARFLIHEAFKHMRAKEFEKAKDLLTKSEAEIQKAHKSQTDLLHSYASGEEIKIEIIMVHAQDHLMTTMTLKEVAYELLALYETR